MSLPCIGKVGHCPQLYKKAGAVRELVLGKRNDVPPSGSGRLRYRTRGEQRQKGLEPGGPGRLGGRGNEGAVGDQRFRIDGFGAVAGQIAAQRLGRGDARPAATSAAISKRIASLMARTGCRHPWKSLHQAFGVSIVGQAIGGVWAVEQNEPAVIGRNHVGQFLIGHKMVAPGLLVPALHQGALGRDHMERQVGGNQGFWVLVKDCSMNPAAATMAIGRLLSGMMNSSVLRPPVYVVVGRRRHSTGHIRPRPCRHKTVYTGRGCLWWPECK